ncbi:MAG: hypothetical protein ACI8PB_001298 [Desulforhopalus sp.]|jgi:hypothetical protein
MDILKGMNRNMSVKEQVIRIVITLIWALLFVMLLKRDVFLETVDMRESSIIDQAESEEYQSVYFKGEKIGYVMQRYTRQTDETINLTQEAQLNLNVAGSVQEIHLNLLATLTDKNLLQDFTFTFASPFYTMEATGKVEGETITYTLDTGTSTITDTVTLEKPPILNTARRPYLLTGNMLAGDKVKIPWFDPFSLTGKESIIEYRGKEPIQIGARIQNLHHFIESFSGARVNLWLDDSGRVVKEESPAGFVFIREPKFKSLKLPNTSVDILSAVAVKVTAPIVLSETTMQYRLTFPQDAILDLQGGRQKYTGGILTITNEYQGNNINESCGPVENYYEPSPYVQSTHADITQLSHELIDGKSDAVDKVAVLSNWVYENIDKRPVLGLPDALTTLKNLQGDCNEHAALFAALARAASLPTRIVAGVTSHNNGFYYHAWNEVCVENNWLSVDTTTNQIPADLTHIRLIVGEMQEQVRIGALLGKLTIEPVDTDR